MLIVDKPMPTNCYDCALDCCWDEGTIPAEYAEKRKLNCPIKGELARCGECKRAESDEEPQKDGEKYVWCKYWRVWKPEDGFCDVGKRKENEDGTN